MAEREKGEFERIIAVNRVKEAQSAKLESQVQFWLPLYTTYTLPNLHVVWLTPLSVLLSR